MNKPFLFAFLMVTIIFAGSVWAAGHGAAVRSGECGDFDDVCQYTLYEDGHLDVQGFHHVESAPWSEFASDVTSLSIHNGGSVDTNKFSSLTNLTNLEINNVTELYRNGFQNNTSVTDLTVSAQEIGNRVFSGMTGVTNLSLGNIASIGDEAFSGMSGVTAFVIPDSLTDMSEDCGIHSPQKVYCQDTTKDRCANLFSEFYRKPEIILYTKDPVSGKIKVGNKTYASFDDIAKGNYIKKRIYTVEEATRLSKPTGNTFMIRYK